MTIPWLLAGLFAFSLPWQTHWLFSSAIVGGVASEYARAALYGFDVLAMMWMVGVGRWEVSGGAGSGSAGGDESGEVGSVEMWKQRAKKWIMNNGRQKVLIDNDTHQKTLRHCLAEPSREARFGSAEDPAPPDEQATTISIRRSVWLIVVGIFTLCITAFFAQHHASALFALVRLMLVAAVATTLWHAPAMRQRFVLGCWLAGMTLVTLLGLWQTVTQYIPANTWLGLAEQTPTRLGAAVVWLDGVRWLRPYASFSHPNIFGGMAALASIMAVVWSATVRSRYMHRAACWFAGIGAVGVAASVSRASLLAIVCGLVAWAWYAKQHQTHAFFSFGPLGSPWKKMRVSGVEIHHEAGSMSRAWARGRTAWLYAGAGLFLGLWLFSAPWTARALPTTGEGQALEQRSTTERTEQVRAWWQWTLAHPWRALVGVGIGQSTLARASMDATPQPAWAYQPVHVTPIVFVWEMGWLLVALLIGVAWRYRRFLFATLSTPAGFTLCITFAPLLLLDHYLWTQAGAWFVVVIIGGTCLNLDSLD